MDNMLANSGFLESMATMAKHNIFCYSRDYAMTQPKEGFEEQWREAKDALDMIEHGAKLLKNLVQPQPTSSLVNELNTRDGVEQKTVPPYETQQITVTGPAIVLIVTD